MELVQCGWAAEGHSGTDPVAETAPARLDSTAGAASDTDQPYARARARAARMGSDTLPLYPRRTGPYRDTGSQPCGVREEGIGRRAGRVSLSWLRRHGRRELAVYGSRAPGAAAGRLAVWLGGLEVPGARSIYWMGRERTASPPVMHHQQPSVSHYALGAHFSPGELHLGEGAAAAFGRLAEQVRTPHRIGGDVCGTRSLSRHGVSGGQLAEGRGDARPHAAGSLLLAAGSHQRDLRVCAQEELPQVVTRRT